jgi:hypothetical protein
MGQSAVASGVKFWLGSPLIPGERVAFGLIWRFGTLDCISDNLDCFENGFGSGSFLDIGSHCFYIAKPFSEEVTDVLDPLSDEGSSCGKSCDFGAMVEVMALGDEEGSDQPRSARLPLECLPLPEQNAPLPEQDTSNVIVVDLHLPLDHVIDPTRVAEALERTRLVLLSKVAEDEVNQRHASTMLNEFYDVHGDALTKLARDLLCSFATMGPSQIQRSPSASRGCGGHGQGGRAPSVDAQGRRIWQGGGASGPR